jgi:hypothetical protein
MNTTFNVYIYIYVLFYLYKGYASYIHISRGYVKHKRLRTTALVDASVGCLPQRPWGLF